MTLTRTHLSLHRSRYFYNQGKSRDYTRLRHLEEKYGKYLWVPLDVDPILPDDMSAFKAWYDEVSIPVAKQSSDIAGDIYQPGKALFKTVTSGATGGGIWADNIHNFWELFPELSERVKQLPFTVEQPSCYIWSSLRQVFPHRDEGPWHDLPSAFRVLLYDSNPVPTLYLEEAPTDGSPQGKRHFIPQNVNAFAWNNIRATHASFYHEGHEKLLLIFSPRDYDWAAYDRLLERSIEKYRSRVLMSEYKRSNFLL